MPLVTSDLERQSPAAAVAVSRDGVRDLVHEPVRTDPCDFPGRPVAQSRRHRRARQIPTCTTVPPRAVACGTPPSAAAAPQASNATSTSADSSSPAARFTTPSAHIAVAIGNQRPDRPGPLTRTSRPRIFPPAPFRRPRAAPESARRHHFQFRKGAVRVRVERHRAEMPARRRRRMHVTRCPTSSPVTPAPTRVHGWNLADAGRTRHGAGLGHHHSAGRRR
jgi:hypothetical protein